MKVFNIFGDIISQESERMSVEDISPQNFKEFIETLDEKEDIEIHINSFGGSCTGGIAIANQIKQLISNGHKVICYIDGLAASIASVIACACLKIKMWKSSMMMIHYCWSVVQGNCETLKKEAETMEKMNKAIVSFYIDKFSLTEEELDSYMKSETWITGEDIDTYKLNAEILDAEHEFKIAASARNIRFNNMSVLKVNTNMENKVNSEEIEKVEEAEVEKQEASTEESQTETEEKKESEETPSETAVEETTEEEKSETTAVEKEDEEEKEPSIDELKKENEELKRKIAELQKEIDEPTDKRVSGMQSKMQAKINTINDEFKAQIQDFKNQLKSKQKELDSIKEESISLKNALDEAKSELHDCVSALEDKKTALAKLNAGVNTPSDAEQKDNWKNLHGKEFFDWCAKHPHGI